LNRLEAGIVVETTAGQVSSLVERIRDIFDPCDMTLVCTTGEINTD
jgi:hypothetical protein